MSVEYIGYVKYEGEGVEKGIFDARKSAKALLGFDKAIRYFAAKEEPYLIGRDYELPVEIRKDSWDIFLPIISSGIIGIAATKYATKTAEKAATDGLFETGIAKDLQKIFKLAMSAMQWVVRIAKHIGSFKKDLQIKHNLEEDTVEIINSNKISITVPRKYYEQYKKCPEDILSKLVENIEERRTLKIGVFEEDKVEEVTIDESSKPIFYKKNDTEEDDEIVCPELVNGEDIELEGVITKVNERANTLGFQCGNYILTIKPASGNVTEYKGQILSNESDHIFRKVKIIGRVSRIGKKGEFLKKPRIIFTSLIPIEEKKEPTLFNGES